MRLLLAAAFACLTAATAWACPAGVRHEADAAPAARPIQPAETAAVIFGAERHAARAALRTELRAMARRIAAPRVDLQAALGQARTFAITLRGAARLAASGFDRRLAPIAAAATDRGPLARLVRMARAETRAALAPYRAGIDRARVWTRAIEAAASRFDPAPLLAGASRLARFAADSAPSLTLSIDAPAPRPAPEGWTEAAADAPPPLARVTARVRDVMRGLSFGMR